MENGRLSPLKFKRGDRVICVHPSGPLKVGGTYRVLRQSGVFVYVSGIGSPDAGWLLDRFELASPVAKPKANPKVKPKVKPRVYVAGPMRGYPLLNFPAFLGAADLLRREGYDVANPAERDLEVGIDPTDDSWEESFDVKAAFMWDLEQVIHAHAVVLLDGWENSVGANAEVATAKAVGVPVMTLKEALTAPVGA